MDKLNKIYKEVLKVYFNSNPFILYKIKSIPDDQLCGRKGNRSYRVDGFCSFDKKIICINEWHLLYSSKSRIMSILIHEVAHAICGSIIEKAHGKNWFRLMENSIMIARRNKDWNVYRLLKRDVNYYKSLKDPDKIYMSAIKLSTLVSSL